MDRFRDTRQPGWDWWAVLWPEPTETSQALRVETGDALVDMCSGDGYVTPPAAELMDDAPVYAS